MSAFDFPRQKLPSLEESYQSVIGGSRMQNTETIVQLPIHALHPFSRHPFQIQEQKVEDLTASIREQGVLSPLMVRETKPGSYEILAGHHRHTAALRAGLDTLPCILRNLDDDCAACFVVESNLQRGFDDMRHSEIARAMKLRHDALKHQGKRTDLLPKDTSCQTGERLAEESRMSPRSVSRYIRLAGYLSEALFSFLDENRIPFLAAEQLSYLSPSHQKQLADYLTGHPGKVSMQQAAQLRQSDANEWDEQFFKDMFHPVPAPIPIRERRQVKINVQTLAPFLPDLQTETELEQYLAEALQVFGELQSQDAE